MGGTGEERESIIIERGSEKNGVLRAKGERYKFKTGWSFYTYSPETATVTCCILDIKS